MPSLELVTAPASEPVTLAEAKTHLRVEATADDSFITALIAAARQWAEEHTGRALISQTWRLWLDCWPGMNEQWWDGVRDGPASGLTAARAISLPRAPLISISTVKTYDDNDDATVWDAANYFADTASQPGRIALRNAATWPQPVRETGGISIEYVAGYGAAAANVPEAVRTACRQLVAHWYEHRGEAGGRIAPAPLTVQALLGPYRILRGRL
ncbi:MAG: hypothetical protein GC131_09015 [Alphaproteobacteria bacterium]|nr:hypothetical protein [Alphaproteobacteria bacterium]